MICWVNPTSPVAKAIRDMKYGILFSTVAVLLAMAAFTQGSWFLLLLWPTMSFAIVASGYIRFGPRVYGKSRSGVLSSINTLFLLPFLLNLWAVWYAVRVFRREHAFDQLTEHIYIGRRLMGHEFPKNIDHVIDLTCEFTEPKELRSVNYVSCQILDGFVPSPPQLQSWVADAARLSGNIYIHCAEGHGRTGLFAAALLLQRGDFNTAEDALNYVKSKRPRVRLGKRQLATLASTEANQIG